MSDELSTRKKVGMAILGILLIIAGIFTFIIGFNEIFGLLG
ncbi:MAG: hypothetical protein R6U96_16075 [Promethearchaeia archaeon]